MERQKVKKSSALAEIRGLFLEASALANWGRLTDDEKRHTADRIERLILRTVPNEQITELKCRRCWAQKPVSDFNKSVHTKSGYESWCRECKNEYQMEWQRRKREGI